jgi:leucyl aminopeptidase (aminopeptidase T)
MPGGEVFFSRVEDSADGVITFADFPAVRGGHEVEGVRLRFEGGPIVEASAARGEDFLVGMLETDEGAIHWDIVKDLRNGGRILCDGEVVLEAGEWVF